MGCRHRTAALALCLALSTLALPLVDTAQAATPQTRSYIVAAGTSAAGPVNCHQEAPELPAVDAACFGLDWPADEQVDVAVDDELHETVLARAVFLDSGGNHLGSWLFCGAGTFEIPAWSATLQVWVQPAWAGAVNTAEAALEANELPCEPMFGTQGTIRAAVT